MMTGESNRKSVCALRSQRICLLILAVATSMRGHSQVVPSKTPPANPDSLVISQYEKRVDDYVKLRKHASEGVPPLKSTESPEQIKQHQVLLASKVRDERSQARQGEIFTPDASELFKKLIGMAYRESDSSKVKASLRRAEPVKDVAVQVNAVYPETAPLQSTPASILANLPPLPKDLEYRIVGRTLVLRDTTANMIVDFIPGALPNS